MAPLLSSLCLLCGLYSVSAGKWICEWVRVQEEERSQQEDRELASLNNLLGSISQNTVGEYFYTIVLSTFFSPLHASHICNFLQTGRTGGTVGNSRKSAILLTMRDKYREMTPSRVKQLDNITEGKSSSHTDSFY